MNYKALKKMIKKSGNTERNNLNARTRRSIAEQKEEIQFFSALRDELRKLAHFYVAEEKRFQFRYYQLYEVYVRMQKKDCDAEDKRRFMEALIHFYTSCLYLENFAIMNYCGFSKILKKHDKITGFDTRSKYMRKMVNNSPFANYPALMEMLANIERLFADISGIPMEKFNFGNIISDPYRIPVEVANNQKLYIVE